MGEFGLIKHLTKEIEPCHESTRKGVGDDCAVIGTDTENCTLITTDLLMEGVHFDLTYMPMRHLGYKAVMVNLSDVYAMNGTPQQITISLAISKRFKVEDIEELYAGMRLACEQHKVDIVGGDTTASMNGLVITISATGRAKKSEVAYRSGAKEHDLICITSNLGAAYMGLHLLEREKRVLKDIENPEPKFAGHEYLLERYLKPRARQNVLKALAEQGIRPTSMIDLSDGLASDLRQICLASQCGARIYLDRIPIAKQTTQLAEEMHVDPVVAALNGGNDYQLMFTVPLAMQEQVMRLGLVDVVGHITRESTGAYLVTPDGSDIKLRAQGFKE